MGQLDRESRFLVGSYDSTGEKYKHQMFTTLVANSTRGALVVQTSDRPQTIYAWGLKASPITKRTEGGNGSCLSPQPIGFPQRDVTDHARYQALRESAEEGAFLMSTEGSIDQ